MNKFSDFINCVTAKTKFLKLVFFVLFFMGAVLTASAAAKSKKTDAKAYEKDSTENIIQHQRYSAVSAVKGKKFFLTVGGRPGFLIWLLLFSASLWSAYVMIKVFRHVKRNRVVPKNLITEVREYLRQGELGYAVESCKESNTPLGRIVGQAFKNIEDGFDAAKDAMELSIKIERENLSTPSRRLLFCGMSSLGLGFCGFCISLVNSLTSYAMGISMGNARLLAISCAQSLYPLIVGTVVSFICFLMWSHSNRKNRKIMVNTEKLAHEMVKVLRGAEIMEDEDFSDKATMTQLFTAPAVR